MRHTKRYRCPECGRIAVECYLMPCLVLETALSKGIYAVAVWFRSCGFRARVKPGGKAIILREPIGRVRGKGGAA
jgi:hypothetical protein